jgi:hypothetical protein
MFGCLTGLLQSLICIKILSVNFGEEMAYLNKAASIF